MPSRRRLARIAVMQTLFEEDFRKKEITDDQREILKRNAEEFEEPADIDFASTLLVGIHEKIDDVRNAMIKHAPEWPIERMDRVTRAILLLATYELLFNTDAPPAVVMNEAIEIAKEFDGQESAKFVNGVLNAIAKNKS